MNIFYCVDTKNNNTKTWFLIFIYKSLTVNVSEHLLVIGYLSTSSSNICMSLRLTDFCYKTETMAWSQELLKWTTESYNNI